MSCSQPAQCLLTVNDDRASSMVAVLCAQICSCLWSFLALVRFHRPWTSDTMIIIHGQSWTSTGTVSLPMKSFSDLVAPGNYFPASDFRLSREGKGYRLGLSRCYDASGAAQSSELPPV